MHKSARTPWREPWHIMWFFLAITFSCWAIIVIAQTNHSPLQALSIKWLRFLKLFSMVGVAAMLGGIMEARRWHLYLAKGLGRITRAAHMPSIVAVSMPTALYSSIAANGLLVSCHAEGRMPTAALIAGGMLNSYMVYISHSLRVLYPVIGLVGMAGAIFFIIQFSGGLLVILGIMLWHYKHSPKPDTVDNPDLSLGYASDSRNAVKPWSEAIELGAKRAGFLIFRMVCITVPLMVTVEWLVKSDAIHIWNEHIPDWLSVYFPPELLTVVIAQLGGMVQSAAIAANLYAEGLITNVHIILGMLVGSVIGSPFRTVRRNLPSALATFTVPVALIVVIGMQIGRFLINCIAIAMIIYGMTHFGW